MPSAWTVNASSTYHFSKVVDASFEEAIAQVPEALKQEGTDISYAL